MNRINVDVAVIGCGCAGASAAVHLGERGYSVALIEKDEGYGQALMGVNGYWAVETKQQKEKHYMSSKKEAFEYLMEHAHWSVDPKIVSDFVNRSAEISHWLTDNGAEIENIVAYFPGCGHTWMYMPDDRRIYHAIVPALEKMNNIKLYDKTSAAGLIMDNGKIAGLKLIDERTEEEYELGVKAVVIATGEEQAVMMGTVLSPYKGTDMAEAVGASRLYPMLGSAGSGPGASGAFRQPHNLFVNKNGRRFMNEAVTMTIDDCGLCAGTQKDATYYTIISENINQYYLENGWTDYKYKMGSQEAEDLKLGVRMPGGLESEDSMPPEMIEEMKNSMTTCQTLEEVAEKTGIPYGNLKQTVEEYDMMCQSGRDTEFYKAPEYLIPLKGGPYFVSKSEKPLKELPGMIRVDRDMKVLNAQYDPIDGLYAAGGACSPINGQVYTHRTAGSRATFALVSGKIAAEKISDYLN